MRLEEEFAGQSQHGTSNNLALAYLELGDYERAQVGPPILSRNHPHVNIHVHMHLRVYI